MQHIHKRGNGHGHGHGAFVDAAKAAVKFNAPERDAWQRPGEILAALGLARGGTVADIGAGTGYLVAHLSRAVGAEGTVIAVDAEEAMIAYLTQRAGALGPATVRPVKAAFDDPGLAAESVDAIVLLDVWHHLEGRAAYATKLCAALKPGGRVAIVEATLEAEVGPPREMRVGPAEAVGELERAGLRARVAGTSMPRHFLAVGEK